MNHLRLPCFALITSASFCMVCADRCPEAFIAVDHQTHQPSHPSRYCRAICKLNGTNSANIDGAVSSYVIGYFPCDLLAPTVR
jgi:hypothetical protein